MGTKLSHTQYYVRTQLKCQQHVIDRNLAWRYCSPTHCNLRKVKMKKIPVFLVCATLLSQVQAAPELNDCLSRARALPLPHSAQIGVCYEKYGDKEIGRKVLYDAAINGDELSFLVLTEFYREDTNKTKEQLFKMTKNVAETKLPMAQFFLGVFYYDGYGTRVNRKLGTKYMEQAAQNKNEIYFLVAQAFQKRKAYEQANHYWQKCADHNNAKCSHALGDNYLYGRGYEHKNFYKALYHLQEACRLGNAESCQTAENLELIESSCFRGDRVDCQYIEFHNS